MRLPISLLLSACMALGAMPAHANPVIPGPDLMGAKAGAPKPTTIRSVRGFLPDLRFDLQASQGRRITQADFQGKLVMMFFGYASCPDICPTTMVQLAAVMESLGERADDVRILFISVDPHRDTPDILQAYVEAFDNRYAIGLTGTERQIADLARRYRVSFQIQRPPAGSEDSNYEVAHSRGIYIFDAQGKVRLLASDSESVDALSAAMKDLLAQG